jgi:hypothetical protein
MHKFHKLILAWNSTCFRQFFCPSSGVYSLYTQQWYMSYRFVDSFWTDWFCWKAVYKPVRHTPVPSVQWINSWWWAEKLPETCRVTCQSKFGKFVHLVGFIIRKFVTMHGHMNINSGTVLPIRPRPLLSAFCPPLHAIIRHYRTLITDNVFNWTKIKRLYWNTGTF